MNEERIMPETIQCPNCGTPNDVNQSLCKNCMTPLTAYSGQLIGEAHQGKLAAQVADLQTRPVAVIAMTVTIVIFALFWPLRTVLANFAAKPVTNAEGTNYIASAFGSIGPILSAALLIPAAVLLGIIAWATWTQRTWAWMASLAVLIVFVLINLRPSAMALFAIGGIALGVLWVLPRTKSWYGL